MVDIAASLSLTPTVTGLDPAAILGAETADNQAFGDILAGQLKASTGDTAVPAPLSTLPTLPADLAGNRQPGGKILPGAAPILPDAQILPGAPILPNAAPLELEVPVAPVLPGLAALPVLPALTPVATVPTIRLVVPQAQDPEAAALEAQPNAAPNPVHSLLKTLAAAVRGQRPVAEEVSAAPEAPAEDSTATADAETAAPTAVAAGLPLAIALPLLPILGAPVEPVAADTAAPSGQPLAAQIPTALHAAAPKLADAAPRDPAQAIQNQPAASQPAASQPAPNPSVAPRTVQAEAASLPVLTVVSVKADVPADAPAAAVTLLPQGAPVAPRPAGAVATARIKVAQGETAETAPLAADRAAVSPLAERGALADRILPTATPIVTDSQSQAATAAPVTASAANSATVMPRHDFAALVERLVEARNASATTSTHASIQHAEFGQVSLHFQQDGGDLKVGMSSADPEFAFAVQAAMPAERQNLNADTRGQQGNQSQNQSAPSQTGTSSNSNHEAAGQRGADAAADQQGSRGQNRNARGGNGNSNSSSRWGGSDQPQSRGGIFA